MQWRALIMKLRSTLPSTEATKVLCCQWCDVVEQLDHNSAVLRELILEVEVDKGPPSRLAVLLVIRFGLHVVDEVLGGVDIPIPRIGPLEESFEATDVLSRAVVCLLEDQGWSLVS